MVATPKPQVDIGDYQYGFRDEEDYFFKSERGLTRDTVIEISKMKGEPEWMLEFRLKAYDHFLKRPMPTWGGNLGEIDFDDILTTLLWDIDDPNRQTEPLSWLDMPPALSINVLHKLWW